MGQNGKKFWEGYLCVRNYSKLQKPYRPYRHFNYVHCLQGKDEHSMVKQSLRISADLHYNGQTSFYSSLMKMSEYYNFPNFNYYTLNENNIKQYIDLMKKKYISYWNQTLQHSQKLNFYCTIKETYGSSAYLDLTRKIASRKALAKNKQPQAFD